MRVGIGLAISIACLFLLLRLVSVDEVAESLRGANPLVLLPAVVLYFLGTAVRSLRWRLLLHGQIVSFGLLFRTLVIGLMVNNLMPARLGEVARVFLLARNARVPVGASIASIVVERVLDGLALTVLVAMGLALVGGGGWLVQIAQFSGLLFVGALLALFWAARWQRASTRLGVLIFRLAPRRFRPPLFRLVESAVIGLSPLARPLMAFRLLGLSLAAWFLEASMYLAIMVGFAVPGGVAAGILGAGAANLATLVPSSPGYVGTFDLALQQVLVQVFGAEVAAATSYAIVVHLTLLVPVIGLGLFFLWRENLTLPEVGRRPRLSSQPVVVPETARWP